VALPAGGWATIAECLTWRFPNVAAAEWARRILAGEVVDEHGAAVTPARVHQPHLRVYYYRTVPDEPSVTADVGVLYRDERLLVADKPHFMPVTPGGAQLQHTLLVRLKRSLGLEHLAPLHRIDRETAGLVLFSLEPATRGLYHELFAQRRMVKSYECIAPDRDDLAWPYVHDSRLVPDTHFMRMREVPGVANARTRMQRLERRGPLARYRLEPETGRRHQLRVHCAALGLPILGDTLYPVLQPPGSDDPRRPLQLLAQSLAFTDPVTGAQHRFTSRRTLDWPPAAFTPRRATPSCARVPSDGACGCGSTSA
jgi:tRNA pseudouridine32 synthase/23S rRNA pseudouridine746 synthase